MKIDAIIRKCKWMTQTRLKTFAKENYDKVYAYLKETIPEKSATTLCLGTIWTCCSLDKGFSKGEWELVSYLVPQFSYEQAYHSANDFYQTAAPDIVRSLIHRMPEDIGEALASVCVAVLISDKKLDGKEMEFLRSL